MVGKFGVCMTDPPIRPALPHRQPDADLNIGWCCQTTAGLVNAASDFSLESNGFTFTGIDDGDLSGFAYYANNPDNNYLPSGEDGVQIYSGMRIERTNGGTFDFKGFDLYAHARSEAVHVASYDAGGNLIGDEFYFETLDTAGGGGISVYDGPFYTFADEVANDEVAYVEILFDTIAGVADGSHANNVDNFVFEI